MKKLSITHLAGCSGEFSHWNNWAQWKRQDSGNMKFLYSSDTHIHKFVCKLHSGHSYNTRSLELGCSFLTPASAEATFLLHVSPLWLDILHPSRICSSLLPSNFPSFSSAFI